MPLVDLASLALQGTLTTHIGRLESTDIFDNLPGKKYGMGIGVSVSRGD